MPVARPGSRQADPRTLFLMLGMAIGVVIGCVSGIVISKAPAAATAGARSAAGGAAGSAPHTAPSAPPRAPDPPPPSAAAQEMAEQVRRLNDPASMGAALVDWQDTSIEVPFAQLERNAQASIGTPVMLRGRVVQIMDTPDGTVVRLATRGSYDNIYWVECLAPPSPTIVERSRVVVAARLAGSHSYQSTAGWQITTPSALAYAVIADDVASRAMRDEARVRRSGR